jgi:hypothetical protein
VLVMPAYVVVCNACHRAPSPRGSGGKGIAPARSARGTWLGRSL